MYASSNNKIILLFYLILVTFETCNGVIHNLNDSMYKLMPPIFHLDNYNSCFKDPDGIFCTATFGLVSDKSSDVLAMIQEYSAETLKHFNHSYLRYGICITQTCKRHMNINKSDLRIVLEGCVNESLWVNYKLKARLSDPFECSSQYQVMDINIGDMTAAAFIGIILIINIVGSLYFFLQNRYCKKGDILKNFSVQRNWSKLVSCELDRDERVQRLKGFYGVRTLFNLVTITFHALFPVYNVLINQHDIEKTYDDLGHQYLYAGFLWVQVFFLITGCLFAFGIQKYSEKHALDWMMLPKGLVLRWLRLTPPYAVVLCLKTTWSRFYGTGPLWQSLIGNEIDACRRNYWRNLLYINNYSQDDLCMVETWYTAADMQLHIVGWTAMIMVKGSRARVFLLTFLFIVGVIAPGAHTYFQDLQGPTIATPELGRRYFTSDPTFDTIHKQTQNYLAAFVIGLSMGFICYKFLTIDYNFKKLKKYNLIFLIILGSCFGITFVGTCFFADGPRASIFSRIAYAAVVRPLSCILFAIVCLGMVFRCDNTYRRLMEWKGWLPLSRISYCAYIIHTTIIRFNAGTEMSLTNVDMLYAIETSAKIVVFTFLLAIPLWLFVEAPVHNLTKAYLPSLINNNNSQRIKARNKDTTETN